MARHFSICDVIGSTTNYVSSNGSSSPIAEHYCHPHNCSAPELPFRCVVMNISA